MTLPPDNHGSDDISNAIGDADPLKWLESLAARQGANPEEFVTSADLDVPEADPDQVVDEPGYQDYDPMGGGSKKAAPAQEPPQAAAPPPPPPPVAEQPPVDEPVMAADDGSAGEMDASNPLAWLESLARRQGANPEEFVTDANMEIEEVDPNTVVDEPGYTPYEAGLSSRKPAQPPAAEQPPKPEPVAAQPEPEAPTAPVLPGGELSASEAAALLGMDTDQLTPVLDLPEAPPAPAAMAAEPGSAMDNPLAWLETLAKRQGAKAEELITSADLEVPEEDMNAVIDEPGYVDYSPFGTTEQPEEEAPEPAAPAPPVAAAPPVEEAAPSGGDTLAWLEGLAAEQGAEAQPLPATEPDLAADPLAGMSDAEIEARAANGELTGAQMEAWLGRQAASLAHTREDVPAELETEADLAPAEPGVIPSWLEEAMPTEGAPDTEVPADAEPAPLVDEITEPPEPASLPDWLKEAEPAAEADNIMDLLDETPVELPVDEEDFELDTLLDQGEASDTWVRALDHEYISQQLHPDEVPDWYQDAVEDPDRLAELEARTQEQAAAAEAEEELAPAEPAAMPDWLHEAAPEDAVAEEAPDWLNEPVPEAEAAPAAEVDWLSEPPAAEEAAAPAEIPDWLSEPVAEQAALPDWLKEAAPEAPAAEAPAAAAPAPAPAAPVPVVQLSAAIPAGEDYDLYRQVLDENPQDHAARLELAGKLVEDGNLVDALGQYEVLAFAEAEIEAVQQALDAIVKANPGLPQARRVLGDVYMRQGKLQRALDTYRAALEQL